MFVCKEFARSDKDICSQVDTWLNEERRENKAVKVVAVFSIAQGRVGVLIEIPARRTRKVGK